MQACCVTTSTLFAIGNFVNIFIPGMLRNAAAPLWFDGWGVKTQACCVRTPLEILFHCVAGPDMLCNVAVSRKYRLYNVYCNSFLVWLTCLHLCSRHARTPQCGTTMLEGFSCVDSYWAHMWPYLHRLCCSHHLCAQYESTQQKPSNVASPCCISALHMQ